MKKFLLALVLCSARVAHGQIIDFAYHISNSANHLDGKPVASSSAVGPYSGTPVLGDLIYFNGTNWVSLAKPADGDYSLRFTASIPSYTAAAGGAPSNATYITQIPNGTLSNEQALSLLTTGLLLSTTATGVLTIKAANTCTAQFPRSDDASGVWTCASVALASDVSGTLPFANIANGSANSVFGRAANSSGVQASIAATSTAGTKGAGQTVKYDGTTLAFQNYPVNAATESIVWNDFMCRPSAVGLATCGPDFLVTTNGAGSGAQTAPAITSDANHPGILELTTGTTTTGAGQVGTQGTAGNTGAIVIGNGSVVEWDMYLPVLSGGTNTHTIRLGWGDIITNADHSNGCYFVVDSNSNANWQIECSKAAAHTGPTASNSAVVAATWYKLRIEIVSGAPHFYVNGTELNVSPLAGTNIPTLGVGLSAKIGATAGCASATTCVLDLDYAYGYMPVTR